MPSWESGSFTPQMGGPDMPEMPPEGWPVQPSPLSRWLRDDGFLYYGGHKFQHTGDGTFRFESKSQPGHFHFVDLRTAPYCSCWGIRRSASVGCCHTITIRNFLKRLKAEQPHTGHEQEDQEERAR